MIGNHIKENIDYIEKLDNHLYQLATSLSKEDGMDIMRKRELIARKVTQIAALTKEIIKDYFDLL